jgi:predicted ATPase/DNA-binding winged helix-turn-helix (wHTH) protein
MTVLPLRGLVSRSKLELAGRMLDLDAGHLLGLDGTPIALRPQAWALLCVLARHAGSVVSKGDLLDAVWPGLIVTDSSLAKAVSDLRAAFGSDGRAVVQTLARRGYRLLASAADSCASGSPVDAAVPAARGPLFGRDGELVALSKMLAQHRLVTVVGAGGIGKTAVALAAARACAAERGSVAWVDLAQLADPNPLIATVARALGLPVAQGGKQLPGLLAALGPLRTLLVLDNAEHLIADMARLTRALLDAAPGLRVLVTSQAPLRLEGEQLFRLGGLDVPDAGEPVAKASRRGAVALLVDQVRAVDRHFELTEANAELVIELCRRLDGVPLAIRLAAARLPLLGLAGVVARLDERLQLLAAQGRDAPARQQTLLAALDWSHGLLSADEQILFRRLGLFAGGFSIDGAVALGRFDGVGEWQLIERLNVLGERSLVDIEPGPPPRYRMLQTQRAFAHRLLHGSGDMARAREHHARAVESVLRVASQQIWVMSDSAWQARWAVELDNVRAALDWSAAHDATLFTSLVGSAGHLFRLLDLGYELRQRADAVGHQILATVATELKMRYWLSRNYLEAGVSAPASHDCARRTEAEARSIAHASGLYLSLCHRVASGLESPADLPMLLAEIETLESPAWPPRMLVYRSAAEHVARSMQRRWARAEQAAQAGLARAMEAGSALMQAFFANGILLVLLQQNNFRAAVERSQELRSYVLPGPAGSALPFVGTCARCALAVGDLPAARRQLAQLFEMCRAVEWMYFDFYADLYLTLAMDEGRFETAACLLGYADAVAQRGPGMTDGTAVREAARLSLAARLAPERMSSLLDRGAGARCEAVRAWALEEGQASAHAPARGGL